MMMRTLSVSMLALLAACSNSPIIDEIIAQTEDDTVQAALVSGKTVKAKSALMHAVVLDYDSGVVTVIDPASFGMKLPDGADEDVTVIVDGTEVTFSASDRYLEEDGVTYYGWEQMGDRPRYSLWSWANGNAANGISPSGDSFVNVWEFFHDREGSTSYRSWTVSGTETAGDALQDLGTASYSGYGEIKAYENNGDDDIDRENRLEVDVEMSADFGAGTISGLMDNLLYGSNNSSERPREPISGEIAMDEATIGSDGQYTGTLTPDAALAAGVTTGTGSTLSASPGSYSGDFFGPAADQTAGIAALGFDEDGVPLIGSGFFNTFKNNDD